jgi:hypothetical protein
MTEELREVEVRRVPFGTFAGTVNRLVILENGESQAMDTGDQGAARTEVYRESKWIVDNELPHPRPVPGDSSLMQTVFLLRNTPSAPVEVELQDQLNRLSYF